MGTRCGADHWELIAFHGRRVSRILTGKVPPMSGCVPSVSHHAKISTSPRIFGDVCRSHPIRLQLAKAAAGLSLIDAAQDESTTEDGASGGCDSREKAPLRTSSNAI